MTLLCCHCLVNPDNVAPILSAISWPLFWFITVALVLINFKDALIRLMDRIKKAGMGGLAMEWDPRDDKPGPSLTVVDDIPPAPESRSDPMKDNWNSFHTFWMAHDFMYTRDVLLRGGPPDRIVHGLNQTLLNLRALRLNEPALVTRMEGLIQTAKGRQVSEWTPTVRTTFADDVMGVFNDISRLLVGFEKN